MPLRIFKYTTCSGDVFIGIKDWFVIAESVEEVLNSEGYKGNVNSYEVVTHPHEATKRDLFAAFGISAADSRDLEFNYEIKEVPLPN